MINTVGLGSNILSNLNSIENLVKSYDPNVHNLTTFNNNVKQTYANLLANSHTQHVLSASVAPGWSISGVTAGVATVVQPTQLTLF